MSESAAGIGVAHGAHEMTELSTSYEIGKLGMWIFLAGETMLFGGLMGVFNLLEIKRGGWGADATHVNWQLAGINTIILFTSSMTAALAQGAARTDDIPRVRRYISASGLLGLLFLVVKALEYAGDVREGFGPHAGLFWNFYYLMTGLHVLHLLAGIVVFFGLLLYVKPRNAGHWLQLKLKYACLYWYFVEVVWVLLYAFVYLIPAGQ